MARRYEQTEWLGLVDISGPFLAGVVLEETFPQGLDKIETPRKQHLRSAYEEWDDARDQDDPELEALHDAWVRLVLQHGLEFEEEVLADAAAGDEVPVYEASSQGETFCPDFVLESLDGAPLLFVAVYPPGTDLDQPHSRGWVASPIERMKLLCRSQQVRVGLLTNGEEWALVNAPEDDTSGHTTWFARNWWLEPVTFKAFVSLLGVRRFFGPDEERLDQLLQRSLKEHHEVTDTLGEQVRRAVEVLVQALGRADEDRNGELLKGVAPAELYNAGLTTMIRLVFLLCAEERGLLLLGDPVYDQHYAISTLRGKLEDDKAHYGVEVLERRYDAWSRLLSLFRAVYGGIEHESLRMPAMGGSLFDPDRFPFLEGRAKGSSWREVPASPLPIDNRTVMLLLRALQVLEHRGGARQLSYRGLDVEQVGHVYEGLLEYKVERVPVLTLGLVGSAKVPRPTMSLQELESLQKAGVDEAAKAIAAATGRSVSAVSKALKKEPEFGELPPLVHACGGDEAIARRLLPFVDLIRFDSWGFPSVYAAGSFAITLGDGRRETGSHYTPRALTEPIVAATLRPVIQALGEQATAEQLLGLKICDPAVGSGAFLVEACRQLAAHVVEAWTRAEAKDMRITVDGAVVDEASAAELISTELADRLVLARRLVAERCLYGVDINPMAVELAKLSLWLVTLSRGRPLGFLDHCMLVGDALLGVVDISQLENLDWGGTPARQPSLWAKQIADAVRLSSGTRRDLQRTTILDSSSVDAMSALLTAARAELRTARNIADAFAAQMFAHGDGPRKDVEAKMSVLSGLAARAAAGDDEAASEIKSLSAEGFRSHPRRDDSAFLPFHWPLEFPEVFSRPKKGFDIVVGNPPFLGNRLWKSMLHERMQWQAEMVLGTKPGKTDLCLLFHRRALQLLGDAGAYGLLGTTNLSEGSAVPLGLGVVAENGTIVYARKSFPWPGGAAVTASAVVAFMGSYVGGRLLDGEEVDFIGPSLSTVRESSWTPRKVPNGLVAFAGVDNSKGLAFLVDAEGPWYRRLHGEPNSLLRPYITGNDITSYSLACFERWALDIADLELDEIVSGYPEAAEFLESVVRPSRTVQALKPYKGLIDRWWQFWNHRADLMRTTRAHSRCVVFSKVTKHPACITAESDSIFTNKVVVVGFHRPDIYALCVSAFFTEWVVKRQGAKLGVGASLTLAIKRAFDTFPLPRHHVSAEGIAAAEQFDAWVKQWSRRNGRGLTAYTDALGTPECTDPEVASGREALVVVDAEVARAYGFDGLQLTRTFAPAPYIQAGTTAFIVSRGQASRIVEFMTLLNQKQATSKS